MNEIKRIKKAATEEEAATCSLWEKIKDWLVGADSSQVKVLLYRIFQSEYSPEEKIEAFLALKDQVAKEYRSHFQLCCTRSDPCDCDAPVSVQLIIEGVYYDQWVMSWNRLSYVDIPKHSNLMVKYADFLEQHLWSSRMMAAGLILAPLSPPDIFYPSSEKVVVTWKILGCSLQMPACSEIKKSMIHPGFAKDFINDSNRADYDFYNHQTGASGHFRQGRKFSLEEGGEAQSKVAENATGEMLSKIKAIYPISGLPEALSDLSHQGYIAPVMEYLHEYFTVGGANGRLPPLMLRQDKQYSPNYVVILGQDGVLSIDAICSFGICDTLLPLDLKESKLTVRRTSTIKLESLLAGNLGDSSSEYHFSLEDRIENQFCFVARS